MLSVLVSGAGRGIGLELARQYAKDGWRVFATCRVPESANQLNEWVQKNEARLSVHLLDVTEPTDIDTLADRLSAEPIDVLINNAAYSPYGGSDLDEARDLSTARSDTMALAFQTNVIGPLAMARAFNPHIAASNQKKIVNISSRFGSVTLRGGGDYVYGPSKSALNAVTKSLSVDLKEQNITVVSMSPGWVRTDMGGADADLSPQESVSAMRETISNLTLSDSGRFLSHEGETVPW